MASELPRYQLDTLNYLKPLNSFSISTTTFLTGSLWKRKDEKRKQKCLRRKRLFILKARITRSKWIIPWSLPADSRSIFLGCIVPPNIHSIYLFDQLKERVPVLTARGDSARIYFGRSSGSRQKEVFRAESTTKSRNCMHRVVVAAQSPRFVNGCPRFYRRLLENE